MLLKIRCCRRLPWLAAWIVAASAVAGAAQAQDLRLVTAAAEQDSAEVRRLLAEGVDANAARADGATALLWAAHWDDLESADRLLAAGASVNAADDHGVTPLERAAENASLPMVRRLVEAGANVNASQASGLTPLMTAARTGSTEVVRLLVGHGADVNAVTGETRSSALMWAVSEPHPEIVHLLLEAGADPHLSTVKGFTPLMFAARNGDIATAEALLAAGVDVNEPSADGTHALPFAITSAQDAFARFLLEQGADANSTINGIPALHAAAGNVGMWLEDWYRRHGRGGLYAGLGAVLGSVSTSGCADAFATVAAAVPTSSGSRRVVIQPRNISAVAPTTITPTSSSVSRPPIMSAMMPQAGAVIDCNPNAIST